MQLKSVSRVAKQQIKELASVETAALKPLQLMILTWIHRRVLTKLIRHLQAFRGAQ